MKINKAEILLYLQRALLGEIYPEIRAIAYRYNYNEKLFVLRFYLDREPTEEDNDNVSTVLAEFSASFKFSDFDKIEGECIYTNESISKIDAMDGFVYARKER